MVPTSELLITDFTEDHQLEWTMVHDGVMGGLSTSRLDFTGNNTCIFFGHVSLDNNGGFTSTRALLPDIKTEGHQTIVLRIRGDGNTYKFRIRTDTNFDGIAFSHDFKTINDQWMEIILALKDFVPTFRGRQQYDINPIVSEKIRQIGFMISDKQEGDFRLEIDWIKLN